MHKRPASKVAERPVSRVADDSADHDLDEFGDGLDVPYGLNEYKSLDTFDILELFIYLFSVSPIYLCNMIYL